MDYKKQIHDSVTESVGRHIYFEDQVKLGMAPETIDTDLWRDKYLQNSRVMAGSWGPATTITYDAFRPRVRSLTSSVLQDVFPIIDKAIASEINEHMKKHFE